MPGDAIFNAKRSMPVQGFGQQRAGPMGAGNFAKGPNPGGMGAMGRFGAMAPQRPPMGGGMDGPPRQALNMGAPPPRPTMPGPAGARPAIPGGGGASGIGNPRMMGALPTGPGTKSAAMAGMRPPGQQQAMQANLAQKMAQARAAGGPPPPAGSMPAGAGPGMAGLAQALGPGQAPAPGAQQVQQPPV